MMKFNQLFLCVVYLLLSSGIVLAANPVAKDKIPVIELVMVKGGCFQMGDVFGGGDKDETPVHNVCVKDFYFGKYEVTQEQWQMVMGDNPSEFKTCGIKCPADSVSWEMAQDFIKKLNAMSKKNYRLPTEAEFEYAARSGGKNEKWAGTNNEESLVEYAWYSKNSNETSHPIGLKKPNALGLYDLSGNVREWCQDWYNDGFYAKSLKDAPVSSEAHKEIEAEAPDRSQRGGGWHDDSSMIRTVARRHNTPDSLYPAYGLRLVLPVQ